MERWRRITIFNAKYFSDDEIWSIIEGIIARRDEVQNLLAKPEISTDPHRMPELAKELFALNEFCLIVQQLKECIKELRELEAILIEEVGEENEDEDEFKLLQEEYLDLRKEISQQIYEWLIKNGYINKEKEDYMDLKILNFLDYAGAEYPWRLGVNVGIDVEEARERLEILLTKGLIERVEGTMLAGYHRQKSWVKHMNHTYYRISREGRLYLRKVEG